MIFIVAHASGSARILRALVGGPDAPSRLRVRPWLGYIWSVGDPDRVPPSKASPIASRPVGYLIREHIISRYIVAAYRPRPGHPGPGHAAHARAALYHPAAGGAFFRKSRISKQLPHSTLEIGQETTTKSGRISTNSALPRSPYAAHASHCRAPAVVMEMLRQSVLGYA